MLPAFAPGRGQQARLGMQGLRGLCPVTRAKARQSWGLLFPFSRCQISAQDLYGQIPNPWKAGLGAGGTQMLPLPCCCNYATKLRKQRKSCM